MAKFKAQGRINYTVLPTAPADLAKLTAADLTDAINITAATALADTKLGATTSDKWSDPSVADTTKSEMFGQRNAEGTIVLREYFGEATPLDEKEEAAGKAAKALFIKARQEERPVVFLVRRGPNLGREDIKSGDTVEVYVMYVDEGQPVQETDAFIKTQYELSNASEFYRGVKIDGVTA